MSYQVGDTVTFSVAPVPSTGSVIYSYVWNWWDDSGTATSDPFVAKTINIGGQPGTGELHYSCTPVAIDGQSTTISGTTTANNPPTIIQGVSISANDAYFSFDTRLQLQAIDQDGDPISFGWYSDGIFLSYGVTSAAGNANGTWSGNGVTIIAPYPASQNYYDLSVASDRVVTCYVRDDQGGTSSVDFSLRGDRSPAPAVSVAAGVGGASFDSITPPTARIGVNQDINFTVFVAPAPGYTISFLWNFSGSNGWTMPPAFVSGDTTVLANGGYQNSYLRDISVEVVSSGTSKVATAGMRVTSVNNTSGQTAHIDSEFDVTLIANSAPSAVTISRSVGGVPVTGPVNAGDKIEFSAHGTDANQDYLFYKWSFAQPSPLVPNPIYFWGPKVIYDTTGYISGASVEGSVIAYDRLGLSLTVVLPSTSIT